MGHFIGNYTSTGILETSILYRRHVRDTRKPKPQLFELGKHYPWNLFSIINEIKSEGIFKFCEVWHMHMNWFGHSSLPEHIPRCPPPIHYQQAWHKTMWQISYISKRRKISALLISKCLNKKICWPSQWWLV